MEGSDGTADTTTLVQIEEAKCAIRKLPFVTILAPVRAVLTRGEGGRFRFRARDAKSMAAVERNKSHQFKSQMLLNKQWKN